jgi:hypothetical protein
MKHVRFDVLETFMVRNSSKKGGSTMAEFALLYRRTAEAHRESMGSPERAQQSMSKWRAWFREMTENGHLTEVGQPLEPVGKVVGGRQKTIADGPYAETKDIIGGFSIIEAKDVEHAARIASGCPILDIGGSVEVRPIMQLEI